MLDLRRARRVCGFRASEQQPGGDRPGGVERLILGELGKALVLPIGIVLGPDQSANALEQGCTRRRQLCVGLGNPSHQTQRQRVAVQFVQAVACKVVEHVICVHARMLPEEKGARLDVIERFEH